MTEAPLLERRRAEATETAIRELPPCLSTTTARSGARSRCRSELGFILQRFVAMAEEDASLWEKQPWKAAYEKETTRGSAAP
jgi:hypothetical protein